MASIDKFNETKLDFRQNLKNNRYIKKKQALIKTPAGKQRGNN